MPLLITSLNVNGLRDFRKRNIVFEWFHNSKFDILFLQEVYCVSEEEVEVWNKDLRGRAFWSFGSSHSRGVGILIKQGLNLEIKNSFRDTEGRILTLDIIFDKSNIRLINLYAPSGDSQARKQFITALDQHCLGSSLKIIGGDFNFIVDSR